jgi:hypothetical protein
MLFAEQAWDPCRDARLEVLRGRPLGRLLVVDGDPTVDSLADSRPEFRVVIKN